MCFPLLLFACLGSAPSRTPDLVEAQRLEVDLEQAWSTRPWELQGSQGSEGLRIAARVGLDAADLRPEAVLVLEGVEGAVTVTVNGHPLHPAATGIAPLRVAVGELLQAGQNDLVVEVAAPSARADALVLGTRPRGARLAAPPRLELGGGVLRDLAAALHDGQVGVEVLAPGAAQVEVMATLDGQVLQVLGTAPVEAGRATLEPTPWSGPVWGTGSGADLVHLWAVAEDADGRVLDARAWRTGLREVAVAPSGLVVGEQTAPVVVLRHSDGSLGDTLSTVYGAGLSGIELHGPPVVGAWLDRADELGLLVVAMPRCDGKVQARARSLDAQAETLAAQDAGLLAAVRAHPSLVLWSVEGDDTVLGRVAAPYAADPVPRVTAGVDVASKPITLLQDPPRVDGPWWCNEANGGPQPQLLPLDAGPRTLARALAAGAVGGVAPPMVLGPGGGQRAGAWLAVWQQAARDLGLFQPPPLRRAPARVQVSGLQPGQVAWLSGSWLPTIGAVAGADGVATLEAWGSGAAELRVSGQRRPVELRPGRWQADPGAPAGEWLDRAWRGAVTTVPWGEAR